MPLPAVADSLFLGLGLLPHIHLLPGWAATGLELLLLPTASSLGLSLLLRMHHLPCPVLSCPAGSQTLKNS